MARSDESMRARLLPYKEHAPAENMAIDEAILKCARRPTLRLYGWSPPGISLGRFQRRTSGLDRLLRSGLTVVRRMTGGGAIVHWNELTYSLFLPADHPAVAGVPTRRSYAVLHAPIVNALRALGVPVSQRKAPGVHGEADSTLCFDRVTDLDLVAGDRKLVGSAQRRVQGRMLQHGSIVLAPNPLQPATASLEALMASAPDADQLAASLVRSFAHLLGPLEEGELSTPERAWADKAAHTYQFA